MKEARNICPKCGGRLLVEAIGNYGDVYRMKADGEMSKVRLRRTIYAGTDSYMVYCEDCRETFNAEDYGY